MEKENLIDGIVSVEIGSNDDYQLYYSEEAKDKLPTKYVIRDGKLFYWWDDNYTVTEEIIAVLWRYNVLQKIILSLTFQVMTVKRCALLFCKKIYLNTKE